MAQHNDLGIKGEALAEEYLRSKGYQILAKNWICDRHEIDIIASNNDFIIFIEVKTRASDMWGLPEEAVSTNKIKRIVQAADFYLNANDIDQPARFDIIAIVLNKYKTEIEHIEDAFMAPLN